MKTSRRFRAAIIVALFVAAAAPASAQTQAQQDRLEHVFRFVVTAPVCQQLGMALDPELPAKVTVMLEAETAGWSLDPAIVDRITVASAERQSAVFKADLETATDAAKTPDQLRGLSSIYATYGKVCVEATTDPLFSKLITAPAGFDPEKAATAFTDTLLAGGGLASWQTQAIRARGDMMMSAGTCRKRIGKARSDALVAEFGRSDDARTRDYYLEAFDIGLNDTEANFTLVQCDRLIARNREDIVKAGSR